VRLKYLGYIKTQVLGNLGAVSSISVLSVILVVIIEVYSSNSFVILGFVSSFAGVLTAIVSRMSLVAVFVPTNLVINENGSKAELILRIRNESRKAAFDSLVSINGFSSDVFDTATISHSEVVKINKKLNEGNFEKIQKFWEGSHTNFYARKDQINDLNGLFLSWASVNHDNNGRHLTDLPPHALNEIKLFDMGITETDNIVLLSVELPSESRGINRIAFTKVISFGMEMDIGISVRISSKDSIPTNIPIPIKVKIQEADKINESAHVIRLITGAKKYICIIEEKS
jgi:hypothetical protein